jgi:hypothetical protein
MSNSMLLSPQLIKKFPTSELKILLSCSEELTVCNYPEPDELEINV